MVYPSSGSRAERGSPYPSGSDPSLLARCLSGDRLAWEEFCEACTPELRRLVRFFLGRNRDDDTTEEIVASVWYALLRDDARILRRYAPERSACLGCYLAGIVRCHVCRYVRAESERSRHACQLACRMKSDLGASALSLDLGVLLNDFAATLNPKELAFLEDYLLSPPNGHNGTLSAADVWQRRHRLRVKLKHFLGCSDD
jgi:DNA-directed RNA polymerase specialized sigma24 family protein